MNVRAHIRAYVVALRTARIVLDCGKNYSCYLANKISQIHLELDFDWSNSSELPAELFWYYLETVLGFYYTQGRGQNSQFC